MNKYIPFIVLGLILLFVLLHIYNYTSLSYDEYQILQQDIDKVDGSKLYKEPFPFVMTYIENDTLHFNIQRYLIYSPISVQHTYDNKILGDFENEQIQVNIGRFGPYLAHDKKFYSLPKEFDPYEIKLEEAIPLIEEKRKAKDERTIKVFEKEKIQLLRGPYGPYIKQGLRNFKLTKEQQEKVEDLTIEEVKEIIEELKKNPPRKTARKKKA
jgi:hypothetical protein